MRIVPLQIVFDIFQIVGGRDGPTNALSGLEHRFKAGVHFFFADKLAPIGCGYSFFYSLEEAGFLVEIARNNLRHQPFGGGSGFTGDLRKLRLLFGAEMYFHALQDKLKPEREQELRRSLARLY